VDCRDVGRLAARFHGDMHRVAELRPETQLTLLERCDALRRPERFELILLACEADYRGRLGWEERDYAQAATWRAALAAIRAVDAGAIARQLAEQGRDGAQRIAQAVAAARVDALRALKSVAG
ncbi:MAG: multifunctional CCA tRNA nucleotidyl transferase/2'3'-cyclic phosphodiesterase/2'nucleotidase/phosphatase, partial [Sulfuritalea sp.]|nr:multifunctional CCA tRNA nucleotidyl transferase/2'3'-cyclic phosphodiesterase/2'nucleotidase/phosphatase [Sulfuritalea sp.]